MRLFTLLLPLAFSAFVSCATTGQTPEEPAAEMPNAQDMEMPMPTDHHRMLHDAVGEWTGTLTMTMPGMPNEPMACSESVSKFGEFWITTEFRSDFMGMPYRGRAVQGYDVQRGKYVGTWIDTMSGFLNIMEGEYNPATGETIMEWEAPDMTGQMAVHRSVTVKEGDEVTMTFWTGDMQTMVIQMTRQ